MANLSNILKSINDVTRTINTVKNTTNSVKRTGQSFKNAVTPANTKNNANNKQQNQEKPWVCACGVSNTTKFCAGCGQPAPKALVCPKCKWVRPIESVNLKFCGNCGTQLEE